jgi:hypothetical protein
MHATRGNSRGHKKRGEQRTEDRGQRANIESREQRAESREQRAVPM